MPHRQFPANDPQRRKWLDPERILSDIGLAPGMIFVDVGSGDGYFAIPAARMVGPTGKVIAIDINADAILRLRQNAAEKGLGQILAEVRSAEETVACEGCADIVFFGINLHDFNDAPQAIRNAKSMLKPSGLLADLDWKPEPMPFGPPLKRRFSVDKATQLIEAEGFDVRSVSDAGPNHYIILAKI
jgi:ubiquinone/menaquinone biosynthesis C-methylase UbiE